MPSLPELHVNRALTDMSIAYRNESFIADMVAPPIPVQKRSDLYFVYNPATFLRGGGTDVSGRSVAIRRPGTVANTIDYDVSTSPFNCEQLAERVFVPWADIRIADNPLDPKIDANIVANDTLRLANETQVANLVGAISNYASANQVSLTTGATGTSWAQYASANSNPFLNIENGRIAIFKGLVKAANAILFSIETALVLADHPNYKDLYKFTSVDGMTRGQLVSNIRGLDVLIGEQQATTSAEGAATVTTGSLWVGSDGNPDAVIYYRNASVGPRTVQSFRTFDAPDDRTGAIGFNTIEYTSDERDGIFIETRVTRDYKAIGVNTSNQIVGAYMIADATV